jgi:hypothetical protein
MSRLPVRRCLLLSMAACVFAFAAHAQQQGRGRKYKPPPPTCSITVTVVKASNGKPVENAAVVFHPIENGKDKGNMELKTNQDGKVTIDIIPMGDAVRLQVIADGFETYGEDYELPGDSKTIKVKLKRPAAQYSIYQSGGRKGTGQQGSQQPENQKPPQ